jgi:hypothetical protein
VASASPPSNESARITVRESEAHNREVELDGTAMGWSAKAMAGLPDAGR